MIDKIIDMTLKTILALGVICVLYIVGGIATHSLADIGFLYPRAGIEYSHHKFTEDGKDHYQVVLKNFTSKEVKIKAYTNLWAAYYNPFGSLDFDHQDRTIETVLPPGKEVVVADYTSAENEWWGRTTQFYWGTEEFVSQ